MQPSRRRRELRLRLNHGSSERLRSRHGLDAGSDRARGGRVAQDDNEGGQLLSQANSANPGEYLTLWGSGLGPVYGR